MAPEKFCFKWKRHEGAEASAAAQHHLCEADVTLVCEGKFVKAHKPVLTANSTFFRELFAADPDSETVVMPMDVSFADLTTLMEAMYLGEVILGKHQLFALLKAADALKVYGRCTFALDTSSNEMPVTSSDPVRSFAICEGPELPHNSSGRETSAEERDPSIEEPSAFASGFVQCGATDNVHDSGLQFATVNGCRHASTPMSGTGVEQMNACTSEAWFPESAVVEFNATMNLGDSKQELFPVTAFPTPSTSTETSGTPSPSSDAMSCDSLDSLSGGSKLKIGLCEVPELTTSVEDAEVGHPLRGVNVCDPVGVALDMPDAGGDTMQQARDAGTPQSATGPDPAPLPSQEEGPTSGANLLRPSKTTRKRTASASNAQATSVKSRTEEASWSGPITRSRAARQLKQ
ncbi:hypothetical protein MTO96_015129 [Rhipicephalus appendiculatus]